MIWKNHDYVRNTRNKISRLKGFTIINMMRTYVLYVFALACCSEKKSCHASAGFFSCLHFLVLCAEGPIEQITCMTTATTQRLKRLVNHGRGAGVPMLGTGL